MWMPKRSIPTSGGDLAVVDAGDPEAPPVVLLHGLFTSSFLWRNLIPLLSPWMRVVAPDLLACGDSAAPADAELGVTAQRRYLGEALDELGVGRFAAVGHAHGGGIAQLLAVDGRVEALCLVDSIAFDAWPSAPVRELQRALGGAGAALADAWIRTAFDLGMSHRERLSEGDLEEYVRPFRGDGGAEAFGRLARAVDGAGLTGLEAGLSRLEIPALVLWGEDDRFLDVRLAERLGEVLPRAAVAVLPGCGHFLFEDALDTVAPLVFQWLRREYLRVEHRHDEGPAMIELGRNIFGEKA